MSKTTIEMHIDFSFHCFVFFIYLAFVIGHTWQTISGHAPIPRATETHNFDTKFINCSSVSKNILLSN